MQHFAKSVKGSYLTQPVPEHHPHTPPSAEADAKQPRQTAAKNGIASNALKAAYHVFVLQYLIEILNADAILEAIPSPSLLDGVHDLGLLAHEVPPREVSGRQENKA
jgi:hypothetical protein